ncbi:MAG: serine hydrolase [bacterium]
MQKNITITLAILSVLVLTPCICSAVSTFDPNHIISDAEMRDYLSWTQYDVQNFLQEQGSYLSKYSTVDVVDQKIKKASEIIYDASKRYEISPKVMLVTLQKEQSLVEDNNPSQTQLDWATGYAVCDSCSTQDPKVAKHKGFATQVDDTAYTYDWYYDNKTAGNVKQKDMATSIDGQTVIPQSWATAFLYTYTPHIHGNLNFWKIWQKWFRQNYPDGTLLRSASSTDVWLVQDGVRRKFKSNSVLITRADPNMIITVPDNELSNYKLGKEISFPNYSILKSPLNYYLLDYDTLRPFASEQVVKQFGYNPQEILEVSEVDLIGLDRGKTITADIYAPAGVVYRITDFKNYLYLIKEGKAYPLLDEKVVQTNYKNLSIEDKTSQDLRKFELMDNLIKFQDGVLLQQAGSDDIYVMENGKKRKFENEKAFLSLGYQQENIIQVNPVTILSIPSGSQLYYTASFDASELQSIGQVFLGDTASDVKDLYGAKLSSYIAAEYPSGKVISGKNIDVKRPVASFVKVFVGYEALQQGLDLKKISTYNSSKHGESGYSLWLADGLKLTNKDILNTMLIGSYNNVAKMTAQVTGLSEKEMVDKINLRFNEWGAKNSKVDDVTGLSENNISTARELLKIFTYSIKDSMDMQIILSKERHDFTSADGRRNFSIKNSNQLNFNSANYKILASKTGYTDEAESVLFLLVQSKKDNKRYVIITLGNSDYNNRFNEPAKIANWITSK